MSEDPPDNLVFLPVVTRLDCPPERVLEAAVGAVDRVVVIGWQPDGGFYFASSIADGPEVLWLLEMARIRLMQEGGA